VRKFDSCRGHSPEDRPRGRPRLVDRL